MESSLLVFELLGLFVALLLLSNRIDNQRHPVVVAKSNTSTRSGFFSAAGVGSKTTTTANKDSSKTFTIGMECFQRKDQPFLDKFVYSDSNPLSIVDTTYTINYLKHDVNWVHT
jgi:hypothetical protein